jgi:ureidoacrylate peracid hydrolase
MHKVAIPQHIIDQVVARRGAEHVYAGLDPRKTALIVVDLQNGFMMPGVAHALCDTAREIVPNVNRIAQALRQAGGKVFWIKNTHDEGCLTSWSHFHEDLTKPERRAKRVESMSAGTKGHELWAELDVRPEDEIVQKTRFSALIQGSSDLEARLRAQGCDTLIITGTVTNVCCESTARDAMMLNFKTIMVTDGNAANSDAEHNASLIAFYLTFGDIMDTNMLVGCLERNAGFREAAE